MHWAGLVYPTTAKKKKNQPNKYHSSHYLKHLNSLKFQHKTHNENKNNLISQYIIYFLCNITGSHTDLFINMRGFLAVLWTLELS